jgi:hypothetical protein
MTDPVKEKVSLWNRKGNHSTAVLYEEVEPGGFAQHVITHPAEGGEETHDPTATIADGADVAQGTTTDTPVSATVVQDATPKTGIGLWKGLVNIGIAIKALLPTALGTGGGLKVDGSGTALPVSLAVLPNTVIPTVVKSDTLVRPANTTAYAANKAVNCNVSVTAMDYSGLTVTLTAANAFSVGDYITVAGVNAGFSVTNVDGLWVCKAGTNGTTVVFDVAVQPTGTHPQTITVGTIAKLLSFDLGGVVGGGIILSEISLSLQGVAMTGAFRLYIYRQPTAVLVDQANFTILQANDVYRRDYYDFYPITEWTGATPSDVCFATIRLWEVFKCDPAYTRVFARLVAEGASTPVSGGIITVKMTALQLLG